MEVFPGSKKFLVSPVFLKRVRETHEHVREVNKPSDPVINMFHRN